ncbi:MAG: hypothetical protein V3T23_06800, partial [Nitrososphaerales archaeon]
LTAQEEARRFGYLIKEEVTRKMGQWFGDLLQPPCHKIYGGECTREAFYCGVPLYLASTKPNEFVQWYKRTGGKPEKDDEKVPTNTVLQPEDLKVVDDARRMASMI